MHISFLLISLLQYTIFVVLPSLLLALYPTRVYRFFCQYISSRKQLAIMSFVEALNNCFRDGLNGTKDYRYFAGVSIFCFPIVDALCGIIQMAFGIAYINIDIYVCVTFPLFPLLVSYIRPCKSTVANQRRSDMFQFSRDNNAQRGMQLSVRRTS